MPTPAATILLRWANRRPVLAPLALPGCGRIGSILLGLALVGLATVGGPASPARAAAPADTSAWAREFDLQGVDGTVRTVLPRPEGLWIGGDFHLAGDLVVGHAVLYTGSTWAALGAFDREVAVFAVHEGQVVAGGAFTAVDGRPVGGVARFDPESGWIPLGTGFEHREAPERCEVRALLSYAGRLFAGGEFTHADGEEAHALAVWDGEGWAPVEGGALEGPFLSVSALATLGPSLIIGGEFDRAGGIASPAVVAWTDGNYQALGNGLGGNVRALHARGDTLFAGGLFRLRGEAGTFDCFAVWDGTQWTSGGAVFGGIDPTIRAIDEFRGELVVAGDFQTIGTERFEQIARWDGQAWRRMSGGFVGTGGVHDLVNWGSTLVAGGAFSNAAGHSAWGLARWGGSAWNPLGFGHAVRGTVHTLVADGASIIAGGAFSRAGRVVGENAARWDGNAWVPLGGHFDRDVLAAVVHEGAIFVAGLFNGFENGISRFVAYLADGVWTAPRGGVAAAARSLTVFQDQVVIGGAFVRAGGRPAERIAAWDGSVWNPLGAGLSDTPFALSVHADTLVAGGRFLRAGNLPAERLARWDGANWIPFPSGPDADVLALLSVDADLIVAGEFQFVDSRPAAHIARWDGSRWSTLGQGFDAPVRALTVHSGRIVAGGEFSRADGKPASGLAFWDGAGWNPIDLGVARGSPDQPPPVVRALLSQDDQLVVGGTFELVDGVVSPNFAIRNGPLAVSVWPGDCDNDGRVSGQDLLAVGRHWGLVGPPRGSDGIPWSGSCADDWNPVTATYADADGSGRVDLEDVRAIVENWGRDRTGTGPLAPSLPEGTSWLAVFPRTDLETLYLTLAETTGAARELRERIGAFLGIPADPGSADLQLYLGGSTGADWPFLELRLPEATLIQLDILDVAGRRVAASRSQLAAGPQRVDLPPPLGAPRSGVYFLRVRGEGWERRLRFVCVR